MKAARNSPASAEFWKNFAWSCGWPAATAAFTNSSAGPCTPTIQSILRSAGYVAAALAMQFRRGLAQLAHFACSQNAARKSRRRGEQFRKRVQRRGARVVTVVDHCKAFCEPHDFAAFVRRLQLREHALRVFCADAPNACGRQRRDGIHHVVATDQRQLEPRASCGRDEIKCGAARRRALRFSPREIPRARRGHRPCQRCRQSLC